MLKRADVLLIFYDLPVEKTDETRKKLKFHKELKRLGFMCVQKSVYAKIIVNRSSLGENIERVKVVAPRDGEICALSVSLNEFKNMTTISGCKFSMSLFADEIVEV